MNLEKRPTMNASLPLVQPPRNVHWRLTESVQHIVRRCWANIQAAPNRRCNHCQDWDRQTSPTVMLWISNLDFVSSFWTLVDCVNSGRLTPQRGLMISERVVVVPDLSPTALTFTAATDQVSSCNFSQELHTCNLNNCILVIWRGSSASVASVSTTLWPDNWATDPAKEALSASSFSGS